MITSEFEYLLISELITMPDRELAQKIELHIWYNSPIPQKNILLQYLEALIYSDGETDFYARCRDIVDKSGLEFIATPKRIDLLSRTNSYRPPGYIKPTLEELRAAEEQQPKSY